ncbi:hypothetical protein [Streptomyces iakyrus]|uniref:oxidoreductase n=1 Tax=Streptomyces iakyrus TaxID=68219 RepID=UPI003F4BA071
MTQYGGSLDNRIRFAAVEVATAVADEIGAGRTGIRISPRSPFQLDDLAGADPTRPHRRPLGGPPGPRRSAAPDARSSRSTPATATPQATAAALLPRRHPPTPGLRAPRLPHCQPDLDLEILE